MRRVRGVLALEMTTAMHVVLTLEMRTRDDTRDED